MWYWDAYAISNYRFIRQRTKFCDEGFVHLIGSALKEPATTAEEQSIAWNIDAG